MLLPSLLVAAVACSSAAVLRLEKPLDVFWSEQKPSIFHGCGQPRDTGPCRALMPRFYFDAQYEECKHFGYGGCHGNANNFGSREDCEQRCGVAKCTVAPPSFITEVEALVSKFHKFNEAPDIIDSFERLGEESQELFRLATPVGKWLPTAANMSWEANSNEARALDKLHEIFKAGHGSESSGQHYGSVVHAFRAMANLTAAKRNISDAANLIEHIKHRLYFVTVDPDFMMDPYFNINFYNIHNAGTIKQTIDHDAVVHCRAPNPAELAKFIKVQNALNRLSSRLNSTHQAELAEGWEFTIDDILRDSLKAPSMYVDKLVDRLNAVNESSLSRPDLLYYPLYSVLFDALSETYYTLRGPAREFSYRCRDLPQTFAFNQTAFRSELAKIRGDLLRIVVISSMFEAKKSPYKNGDHFPPPDYDINGHALTAIDKTGKEIAKWAREILEFPN